MKITKSILQRSAKALWTFPVFMAASSALGMIASAILSIEKTRLLENPAVELLCDINPVYSCRSVALSEQASVFGFSNELIGIAYFAGMLALALGMIAGATYKKWLHMLAWLGLGASMAIVVWFLYQSVYVINALCIYCSIVWIATWTLFVGYSRWLINANLIPIPKKARIVRTIVNDYPVALWFIGVAIAATLILSHFWYFYNSYFS